MGKFIENENLYHIVCRNKGKGLAYAEKIKAYRKASKAEKEKLYLLGNEPGWYIDRKNSVFTCDITDIVTDPVIVENHYNTCYLIKL